MEGRKIVWRHGVETAAQETVVVRSKLEIDNGLALLRDLTRFATKSYEGRQITTCISVMNAETVEKLFDQHNYDTGTKGSVMFEWPAANRPSFLNRPQLEHALLMVEGRGSTIVATHDGEMRGVVHLNYSHASGPKSNFGGFNAWIDRHRFVHVTFALHQDYHHDGFSWHTGLPNNKGILYQIEGWADKNLVEAYTDENDSGSRRALKQRRYENGLKWDAFRDLLSSMSERRLSSIFVVCGKELFDALQSSGTLTSLRSDLEGVKWGEINERTPVWTNLFRLDGAHFVSKEMEILALCQRITVPNKFHSEGGTGRTAVRYLSEKMGKKGVCVKVSSDGPISGFLDGQII